MLNQKENECSYSALLKDYYYICACAHTCAHMCKSPRRPEECAGSLGVEVTGDSELPHVAAGN